MTETLELAAEIGNISTLATFPATICWTLFDIHLGSSADTNHIGRSGGNRPFLIRNFSRRR